MLFLNALIKTVLVLEPVLVSTGHDKTKLPNTFQYNLAQHGFY